jgi:hypothetical protein
MNFAELAAEVEVHLNPEGTKVKFTWKEYVVNVLVRR